MTALLEVDPNSRRKALVAGVAMAAASAGAIWVTSELAASLVFRNSISDLAPTIKGWWYNSVLAEVVTSAFGIGVAGIAGGVIGVLASRRRRAGSFLVLPILPVVACLAVMLMWEFHRITALAIMPIALVLLAIVASWPSKWRWAVSAWLLFLALAFVPIDVTTLNVPGGPHFVRLAMGLPSKEMWQAAERGEIVLGGCVSTGHEPTWVLVW